MTIGMGVGSLSMIVPMYNAEIAPPEVRGALVGLQQMSITLGIMISFWIDYGTVSSIPKLSLRNNDTDRSRILLEVQARDSTMVHGSYP
jgi:MFS family permease